MGRIKKKKVAKAKKPIKKKPVEVEHDPLPDMGNDPFFVKKAEEARADFIKLGFVFDA
jgi:hypothetical protein